MLGFGSVLASLLSVGMSFGFQSKVVAQCLQYTSFDDIGLGDILVVFVLNDLYCAFEILVSSFVLLEFRLDLGNLYQHVGVLQ